MSKRPQNNVGTTSSNRLGNVLLIANAQDPQGTHLLNDIKDHSSSVKINMIQPNNMNKKRQNRKLQTQKCNLSIRVQKHSEEYLLDNDFDVEPIQGWL